MIDGTKYVGIVKLCFSFLITEFKFRLSKETKKANVFYDVEYSGIERAVSVSYENIEDHLQVIVFKLKNGKLPDYDDKTCTFHLNQLNKRVLSKIDKHEIKKNNKIFDGLDINGELEQKLLKSAKELRLVLRNWDKV